MWPAALLLLLLVPLAVVGYRALLRRRERHVKALAAEGFVAVRSVGARRHVPFVFFLAALAVLIASLARPRMEVGVPQREGTVILAFDVSNSMLATDLDPSRIEAAKKAARSFVEKQPGNIKIGVVAFSEGGFVTQEPTQTKDNVIKAIDRLTLSGGTSLSRGIYTSLNAIAGKPLVIDESQLESDGGGVDIGFYGSSAVIMLSDGDNTDESDPSAAAQIASVAGVKIYTIGIGSPEGTVVEVEGFNTATALNEELLIEIADRTDAKYFAAVDETELAKVYEGIDLEYKVVKENTEITAIFTAVGIGLLVLGAALSLAFFGRVV